nr:T9SS type A sorting domain-containing protein [Fibrobacterota bacterium]
QSKQTRKIEIQFVQGMGNNGDAFNATLPIIHSLVTQYQTGYGGGSTLPKKNIGVVSLTATSLDGKTYALNWPGLGSGAVGPTPLKLHAIKVEDLKEGVVSSAKSSCVGCLTPWISDHSGSSYFGVTAVLEGKKLALEAQPTERYVIVDVGVDAMDSLAPARSRKLALLALKAYAQAPYSGNLGFSDGNGSITYVFPKPVEMTAANLLKAYESLKSWKPLAKANAKLALEAFAKGRGTGSKTAVALLINNDSSSYYHFPPIYNEADWPAEYAKYEKFEAEKAIITNALTATLKSANTMLFGYWNDHRLSEVAASTGGFQVGMINGWIYPPYYGDRIVGLTAPDRAAPQPVDGWYLPSLFGPGRPDSRGVTDLKVAISGAVVTDFTVLQEVVWYRMYSMNETIVRKTAASGALAKSSDIVMPYPYQYPESTTVLISGRYQGSGKATLKMTGMLGGLRFSQEYSIELGSSSGAGAGGASLWSYQQVEAWGRDQAVDDIAAMVKMGKDYHVVNRQMSLLALEPGMDLWTELPSKPGQRAGGTGNLDNILVTMEKRPLMVQGMSIDEASLEDILNGNITGLEPAHVGRKGNGKISLAQADGAVGITWSYPGNAQQARFQVLDLSGRLVSEIPAVRNGETFSAKWRSNGKTGTYFLVARAGEASLTRKIVLQR